MTIPPVYVGCDISKSFLDFCDPSDGAVRRIANSREAIDAYLTTFAGRAVFVVYEG